MNMNFNITKKLFFLALILLSLGGIGASVAQAVNTTTQGPQVVTSVPLGARLVQNASYADIVYYGSPGMPTYYSLSQNLTYKGMAITNRNLTHYMAGDVPLSAMLEGSIAKANAVYMDFAGNLYYYWVPAMSNYIMQII